MLQLVQPQAPSQPLVQRQPRSSAPRRPGERLEAVAVAASGSQAATAQAHRYAVTVDVAVTLLLEAHLAQEWAQGLGQVLEAEEHAPAAVALSAAEADYLRALTFGRTAARRGSGPRSGDGNSAPSTVAVPVRLLAHCTPQRLDQALEGDLRRALAFEISALRAGLTVGEWAARQVAARLAGAPVPGARRAAD